MELGPIFRSLMHNKSRFWLITLEVALTLAIVANCVNMILDMRGEFLRETGIDEADIVALRVRPFDPAFKEEEFLRGIEEEDLRRLRAFPGVVDAVATSAVPLSGGGSGTERYRTDQGPDAEGTAAPYFVMSDHALSTLGVELTAGRDFVPGDFVDIEDEEAPNAGGRNVLLTQAMADALFPDGDAVGRQIRNQQGEIVDTVVGVIRKMHNSWPRSEWGGKGEHVMLRPGSPGDYQRMQYLVRTEPGALDTVYAELESIVREVHPGRTVETQTLTEFKEGHYQDNLVLVRILGAVIVLLVVVTALGIVGLTSFSVTERTRQIGTRRALGATKTDIVRYFLLENWMITGIGIGIGIFLTYGLNYALVHTAEVPKIGLGFLAAGALALWATGVLAAVAPALRATTVAPEVATRSV